MLRIPFDIPLIPGTHGMTRPLYAELPYVIRVSLAFDYADPRLIPPLIHAVAYGPHAIKTPGALTITIRSALLAVFGIIAHGLE